MTEMNLYSDLDTLEAYQDDSLDDEVYAIERAERELLEVETHNHANTGTNQ